METNGISRGFVGMVRKPPGHPKSDGILVGESPNYPTSSHFLSSADQYDSVVPMLPHLSHATPTSAPLLSFTAVTLVLSLPILPLIPLRPIFLVVGLMPFILTHPTTQQLLPLILSAVRKMHFTSLQRIIDNDRLDDAVWAAPLQEVDLWENERWGLGAGADAGWSKANLKRGERNGWSRRRDGWSDANALTGSLDGDVRSVPHPSLLFIVLTSRGQ